MTVKQILPFGDPILRKKAKPIEAITPRIIQYLDDLKETLYDGVGRAGLAAPQIGILRQLLVMDCGDGLIELINPVITHKEGEQLGDEGCLSLPGYYGLVTRANQIKVTSLNRQGEEIVIEGQGFLARCIQHEIDHLNGILFIDHVQEEYLIHETTKLKLDVFKARRLSNPDNLVI